MKNRNQLLVDLCLLTGIKPNLQLSYTILSDYNDKVTITTKVVSYTEAFVIGITEKIIYAINELLISFPDFEPMLFLPKIFRFKQFTGFKPDFSQKNDSN